MAQVCCGNSVIGNFATDFFKDSLNLATDFDEFYLARYLSENVPRFLTCVLSEGDFSIL